MPTLRLKELRLPPGDVRGFDIDYAAGTGRTKLTSSSWLSEGYDGVRIIGDRTHIRPVGDQALLVDRHNGVVQLEGVTVHCGARQGIWFGLEGKQKPTLPKFKLVMRGCEVVADMPPAGSQQQHTTVWGIFSYQADLDLEDTSILCERSAEHASYAHGFAKTGLRWNRVRVEGSGSQGCKVRNSPAETNWVRGARIHLTDCKIVNVGQPAWWWRGPGNFVVEGGGYDIWLQRCELIAKRGPEYCRAVMIDDSEGDFFDAATGAVGRGCANGHVYIERCGLSGGPGTENLTPILRVANNPQLGQPQGGSWSSCRSLTVKDCGIWGERTQLQLGNVPAGKLKVSGCNTQPIKDWCGNRGYDTAHETVIPGQHTVIHVSEGMER
jgi:hypothetical protein